MRDALTFTYLLVGCIILMRINYIIVKCLDARRLNWVMSTRFLNLDLGPQLSALLLVEVTHFHTF